MLTVGEAVKRTSMAIAIVRLRLVEHEHPRAKGAGRNRDVVSWEQGSTCANGMKGALSDSGRAEVDKTRGGDRRTRSG